MSKVTYRVEIRYARQGWFLVAPTARGLTARRANAVAAEAREFERGYAGLGIVPRRVRVVRESDGRSLWLA